MSTILNEIIELLTGGITGIAAGVGQGLSVLARDMFLTYTQAAEGGAITVTGLSTFGSLVVIFAGIGLAVGLSRLIFNWVTSLGN